MYSESNDLTLHVSFLWRRFIRIPCCVFAVHGRYFNESVYISNCIIRNTDGNVRLNSTLLSGLSPSSFVPSLHPFRTLKGRIKLRLSFFFSKWKLLWHKNDITWTHSRVTHVHAYKPFPIIHVYYINPNFLHECVSSRVRESSTWLK
jgi:hypothetical protein